MNLKRTFIFFIFVSVIILSILVAYADVPCDEIVGNPAACPSDYTENSCTCSATTCIRNCSRLNCTTSVSNTYQYFENEPDYTTILMEKRDETDKKIGDQSTDANHCYKMEFHTSEKTSYTSQCFDLDTDATYGDYDLDQDGDEFCAITAAGFRTLSGSAAWLSTIYWDNGYEGYESNVANNQLDYAYVTETDYDLSPDGVGNWESADGPCDDTYGIYCSPTGAARDDWTLGQVRGGYGCAGQFTEGFVISGYYKEGASCSYNDMVQDDEAIGTMVQDNDYDGFGENQYTILTEYSTETVYSNQVAATNLPEITVLVVGSDSGEPWTTTDETPTIQFETSINTWCRLSNSSQNYTQMTSAKDCSGSGQNSTSHSCTAETLGAIGSETNQYIACSLVNDNGTYSAVVNVSIQYQCTSLGWGGEGNCAASDFCNSSNYCVADLPHGGDCSNVYFGVFKSVRDGACIDGNCDPNYICNRIPVAPIQDDLGIFFGTNNKNLSWSNSTDPDGDAVTYDGFVGDIDSWDTTRYFNFSSVSDTNVTANNLVDLLVYRWQVRACDSYNYCTVYDTDDTFTKTAGGAAPDLPPAIEETYTTPTTPDLSDIITISVNVSDPNNSSVNATFNLINPNGLLVLTNDLGKFQSGNVNLTQIINSSQATINVDGLWTWNLSVTDANYTITTSGTFDTAEPNITFTSPNSSYSSTTVPLQFIPGDNVDVNNCWYTVYNESQPTELEVNKQGVGCAKDTLWSSSISLYPRNFTILVFVNDTYGNIINTSANFQIIDDGTLPVVTITAPQGSYISGTIPLEYTATDTYLEQCYYTVKTADLATTIIDEASLPGCLPETSFSIADVNNYTVFVYANDTNGNLGVDTSDFAVTTISGSGDDGGGGGGDEPTVPTEDKSSCEIVIDPQSIILKKSKQFVNVEIINNEEFGFDTEIKFQAYSELPEGSIDGTNNVQVTTILTKVQPEKSFLFEIGIKGDYNDLDFGTYETVMLIGSPECSDIAVPVELRVGEPGFLEQLIDGEIDLIPFLIEKLQEKVNGMARLWLILISAAIAGILIFASSKRTKLAIPALVFLFFVLTVVFYFLVAFILGLFSGGLT